MEAKNDERNVAGMKTTGKELKNKKGSKEGKCKVTKQKKQEKKQYKVKIIKGRRRSKDVKREKDARVKGSKK